MRRILKLDTLGFKDRAQIKRSADEGIRRSKKQWMIRADYKLTGRHNLAEKINGHSLHFRNTSWGNFKGLIAALYLDIRHFPKRRLTHDELPSAMKWLRIASPFAPSPGIN